MAIYAIAIGPLIDNVQNEAMQIWYTDDAMASGKLSNLKELWDKLSVSGPDFGYFPNAQKSVVVTKPSHLEEATRIFAECKMTITTAPLSHEHYNPDYPVHMCNQIRIQSGFDPD